MDDEFIGDESFDFQVHRQARRRQPSPHHMRTEYYGNSLSPGYGNNLQRSRSQGHGPAPTINVYNRLYQDNENASPYPPPARTPPRRVSPEYRGRRLGDEIVEDLAGIALDNARYRSRSRGRSDAPPYNGNAMAEWELAQRNAQIAEQMRSDARRAEWELQQRNAQLTEQTRMDTRRAEWELAQQKAQMREDARKAEWEREADRIKNDYKLHNMEDELKREREQEALKDRERRYVQDYERKQREERKRFEDEEQRIKDKIERDARDAKDRRDREMKEFELKQREEKERKDREYKDILMREKEAKEKRDREIKEILLQEKEAKEKREKEEKEAEEKFLLKQKLKKEKEEREEKEAEEKFLRKQREKKEKEDKEKKEAEEKFQAEMRKRLSSMGYTEKTIEVLVDQEKGKKFKETVQTDSLDVWRSPHRAPTYPKIHRDYLDVETLRFYGLPWKYDPGNPDYIIILQDMEKRETDILFEHTTRYRNGTLLIEGKKKDKEFAWYRKRSHSRGAPARVGIFEIKR